MRALIIDDEPMPAKRLASMVAKHCFEIKSTEICSSPSKALSRLKEVEFDLIFLDIEMPQMNGFEFLEQAMLPKKTQLVITTAYQQYAIEAFNADALHYLVKPVKEADLVKAIRKVVAQQANTGNYTELNKRGIITLYEDNEYHIIREEDIIRLEADGTYTKFILQDKNYLSSSRIGVYEEKLSKELFFRVHKSHIINLREIEKLGRGRKSYVVLSNEDVVPISQTKQESLEQAMGI